MRELTAIEESVLVAIQPYYPNSWHELKRTYLLTESFDNTIKLLENANSLGCLAEDIYKIIKSFKYN